MRVDSAIRPWSAARGGILLALVLVPAMVASADEQHPPQAPQGSAVAPDLPVAPDPPQGSSSEQSVVVPRAAPGAVPPAFPAIVPPAVSPAPNFVPGFPGSGFSGPSVAPVNPDASFPTFLGAVNRILEWTGPGCCPTPSFGKHTLSGGNCLCDSQDLDAPPLEYAPNFLGDLQSPGAYVFFSSNPLFAKYIPLPIAAGNGGFKISDNDNPIPTSRLFFDYNHAANALQDTAPGGKINFDRYTLGIEQVLFWDSASLELRLPVAAGLISDLSPDEASGAAFGNIPMVFKQTFYSEADTFLSGGLAVVSPTAPEAVIQTPAPRSLTYVVRNESVHLGPFLGVLLKPDPRAFLEGFLQVDFVTNGDAVFQNVGGTLTKLGVYQAQTSMSVDLKAGYWLYRGPEAGYLMGIAPSVEFHYTAALQKADTAGPVTNPFSADVCDVTAGLHAEMQHGTDLAVGLSVPLMSPGADRPYDSEVIVQLNQRY